MSTSQKILAAFLQRITPNVGEHQQKNSTGNFMPDIERIQNRRTENEKDTQKLSRFSQMKWSIFKGILYSGISGLFFSLCSVIVKYLKDIDPGELAMFRFLGILVFTLPTMLFFVPSNPFGPKDARPLLLLRGLIGSANLYLNFVAFRNLPLADASVIVFSSPVFVSILAKVLLKEPCGVIQTISLAITVIGLVFTSKLPFITLGKNYSSEYYLGLCSAFGSVFLRSFIFIFLRKLKNVNHFIVLFNFSLVAVIETIIITSLLGKFSLPACGNESILIIFVGVFSFLGQTFFTASFQFEQAGPISIVRSTSDILLSFIWEVVIFRDIPDMYSILGAIMVLVSVLLVILQKWVRMLNCSEVKQN